MERHTNDALSERNLFGIFSRTCHASAQSPQRVVRPPEFNETFSYFNGRTRGHLHRVPDDYRSFEPDYPAFPGWLGNGEIIKKQKYSIQRCTSCVSGFR